MNKNWVNIPVEIYLHNVVICVDQSAEEAIKWGKANGLKPEKFTQEGIEQFKEAQDALGFCHTFSNNGKHTFILIWLSNKPVCVNSYGILYHELYHAVDYIARNIDGETILYNEHKNSEPRAYLYQY